jgi:hypothetical protein
MVKKMVNCGEKRDDDYGKMEVKIVMMVSKMEANNNDYGKLEVKIVMMMMVRWRRK